MKYEICQHEENIEDWGKASGKYYVWCTHPEIGDGFEIEALSFITNVFGEFLEIFVNYGIVIRDRSGKRLEFYFQTEKKAQGFLKKFEKLINSVELSKYEKQLNSYSGTLKTMGNGARKIFLLLY